MVTLRIDIETYSEADLTDVGLYRYVDHPSFEILLLGYAYDDEPARVIDLANDEVDEELDRVLAGLKDPRVLKTAYNAAFERTCLAKYFGLVLPPEQWSCTMIAGMRRGLPAGLAKVAEALGLEQQKMAAGKALIRYFSMPCAPTKANGGRRRNLPHHDPEKWELFKSYCAQDVEVERAISQRLESTHPRWEDELWALDQRINDRGIRLDPLLVASAIAIDEASTQALTQEFQQITAIENPAALGELKDWLSKETGARVESLTKGNIDELIATAKGKARRVLELRKELSKTSTSKYRAMDRCLCSDGRAHGLLQFYGASRTGRWAGRLIQVQNLPQNKFKDLDLAREMALMGDYESLEMVFGAPSFALSQLIRTAFVPDPGKKFVVADFSAIEARVIAWLAGEKWRMDVFATHGKIYEASAAAMFKVPIESIGKGSPLRQKGKIAELALGFGGGPKALQSMDTSNSLDPEELPKLVKMWRNASPKIVKLWRDVEGAVKDVLRRGGRIKLGDYLQVWYANNELLIWLPSGRPLVYQSPRLDDDSITYMGMDQTTNAWCEQRTYGGKLVENIVQATARDCLAMSMLAVEKAGYPIVMHVHDEIICEVDTTVTVEEITDIMGRPLDWAPGLLLRGDGYECSYYRKD